MGCTTPSNAQAIPELSWRKLPTVLEKDMRKASNRKLETKKMVTFHCVSEHKAYSQAMCNPHRSIKTRDSP